MRCPRNDPRSFDQIHRELAHGAIISQAAQGGTITGRAGKLVLRSTVDTFYACMIVLLDERDRKASFHVQRRRRS
jgi:hypothetical protein